MRRKLVVLLMAAFLAAPALAGAQRVTPDNFVAKTTRDLLTLCTASRDDPQRVAAIHFCEGYLVGAFAYAQAANTGPDATPIVCPDPMPTRDQAISMFIEWAKAHPQFMDEKPVETEFRFLDETWPCQQ